MTNKNSTVLDKEGLDGFTKTFPWLLGGLKGDINEFEILGYTLQRLSDGDFRCILRGIRRNCPNGGVRLVAFSNAGCPAELLAGVDQALSENTLRWHVDRYANDDNGHVVTKIPTLTLG